MKRITAAVIAAFMLLLSGCADSQHHPLEDEPGWNCLVDGNGHCGPSTYTGKVRLVAYWDCEGDDTDYSYSDHEC